MNFETQENLDKILINLDVISEVKEGQKLHLLKSGFFEIQDPGFLVSGIRFFYNLNRQQTIEQIKMIIQIYEIFFEKQKEKRELISLHFEKSLIGLKNLKLTYKTDVLFVANINLIIKKIKIKFLQNKIENLKKIKN